MKHVIPLLMLLLSVLSARAGDYKSLVFQTSGNATTSVDLSSLVITVSDGKLVVTNTAGTQSFTLTDLSKMYFSTETTGIKGVSADGASQALSVYDLQGRSMGNFKTIAAARTALRQGVYVVKQGNKTYKIAVK